MENKFIVYRGTRLTAEEYNALWRSQGGICAACGHKEQAIYKKGTRILAVDHCHTTGKVRGLLCGNCNRALGLLYEDPERIKGLLRYVEDRCINTHDINAEIARHYVLDDIEPGTTDNLY